MMYAEEMKIKSNIKQSYKWTCIVRDMLVVISCRSNYKARGENSLARPLRERKSLVPNRKPQTASTTKQKVRTKPATQDRSTLHNTQLNECEKPKMTNTNFFPLAYKKTFRKLLLLLTHSCSIKMIHIYIYIYTYIYIYRVES